MIFKAVNSTKRLDSLVCWTGQDREGRHWNVVCEERYLKDAVVDALLIARLLNWYYFDSAAAEQKLQEIERD